MDIKCRTFHIQKYAVSVQYSNCITNCSHSDFDLSRYYISSLVVTTCYICTVHIAAALTNMSPFRFLTWQSPDNNFNIIRTGTDGKHLVTIGNRFVFLFDISSPHHSINCYGPESIMISGLGM